MKELWINKTKKESFTIDKYGFNEVPSDYYFFQKAGMDIFDHIIIKILD